MLSAARRTVLAQSTSRASQSPSTLGDLAAGVQTNHVGDVPVALEAIIYHRTPSPRRCARAPGALKELGSAGAPPAA